MATSETSGSSVDGDSGWEAETKVSSEDTGTDTCSSTGFSSSTTTDWSFTKSSSSSLECLGCLRVEDGGSTTTGEAGTGSASTTGFTGSTNATGAGFSESLLASTSSSLMIVSASIEAVLLLATMGSGDSLGLGGFLSSDFGDFGDDRIADGRTFPLGCEDEEGEAGASVSTTTSLYSKSFNWVSSSSFPFSGSWVSSSGWNMEPTKI